MMLEMEILCKQFTESNESLSLPLSWFSFPFLLFFSTELKTKFTRTHVQNTYTCTYTHTRTHSYKCIKCVCDFIYANWRGVSWFCMYKAVHLFLYVSTYVYIFIYMYVIYFIFYMRIFVRSSRYLPNSSHLAREKNSAAGERTMTSLSLLDNLHT